MLEDAPRKARGGGRCKLQCPNLLLSWLGALLLSFFMSFSPLYHHLLCILVSIPNSFPPHSCSIIIFTSIFLLLTQISALSTKWRQPRLSSTCTFQSSSSLLVMWPRSVVPWSQVEVHEADAVPVHKAQIFICLILHRAATHDVGWQQTPSFHGNLLHLLPPSTWSKKDTSGVRRKME